MYIVVVGSNRALSPSNSSDWPVQRYVQQLNSNDNALQVFGTSWTKKGSAFV